MQQNNRFGWASLFGVGGQDDDLWTEEERKRLQRARMQAMGSGLLEASGWSSTPVTFGQAWANASGRGQEAQQYAEAGLMQRRQMTAEQANRQRFEEWLKTLPPEQAQLYRLFGPQEGPKQAAQDRRATIKAGNSKGYMNVPAGGAIFDPATGKPIFENTREIPYDVVEVNMPDGRTVQAQRDPRSGALFDLRGNPISGGPGASPQPQQDVAGQIEAEAGQKLKPEARERVNSAAASGRQFNVSATDFVGGLGVSQSPAEQRRAEKEAEAGVERQTARPAAEARLRSGLEMADRVRGNVKRAKETSGFWSTGIPGQVTRLLGGTSGKHLAARLDTVKANLGFAELQKMRENSPTGGALGGIAVKELDMLQATIESLDQAQSEEELDAALDRIDQHLERWQAAMQQDFEARYGGGGRPAGNARGFRVIGVE